MVSNWRTGSSKFAHFSGNQCTWSVIVFERLFINLIGCVSFIFLDWWFYYSIFCWISNTLEWSPNCNHWNLICKRNDEFKLDWDIKFWWLFCTFKAIFCYDSPCDHPFISAEEKSFLRSKTSDYLEVDKKTVLTIPWKAMLTSTPVLALFAATVSVNLEKMKEHPISIE